MNVLNHKSVNEYKDIIEKIKDLVDLLSNSGRITSKIVDELSLIKSEFGDERRSEIQIDAQEISIEDQRINKIKELLETVEVNKSIYIKEDQLRINEFLDLIDERQSMLSKAKTDLQNENIRNHRYIV